MIRFVPLCLGVFGLIFSGCRQNQPPDTAASLSDSTSATIRPARYITATASNVRIRSTPDLQGEIVEMLPPRALVEYLDDSTTFSTEFMHLNEVRQGRWYKVRTPSGKEGWIFGGLSRFLTDAENQQILAQRRADPTTSNGGAATAQIRDTKIDPALVARYQQTLATINARDSFPVEYAISVFEAQFANASMASCDLGFAAFLDFMQGIEGAFARNLPTARYQALAEDIRKYGRAPMVGDPTLERLGANGFNFGLDNGRLLLKLDADFIARRFYRFVSPSAREYLNQTQLESETLWRDGDKLLLPFGQYAEWAVFWAIYLEKYPDAPLSKRAEQYAALHRRYFAYGSQVSPLFDGQQKLLPEVKAAYAQILQKHPQSRIGQQLQRYWQALEDDEFTRTNAVQRAQQAFYEGQ